MQCLHHGSITYNIETIHNHQQMLQPDIRQTGNYFTFNVVRQIFKIAVTATKFKLCSLNTTYLHSTEDHTHNCALPLFSPFIVWAVVQLGRMVVFLKDDRRQVWPKPRAKKCVRGFPESGVLVLSQCCSGCSQDFTGMSEI